MTYHTIKNTSYAASVAVHIILLIIFLLVNININYPPKDYVEVTFGKTGKAGSSGAAGEQVNNVEQQVAKQPPKKETQVKKEDLKKVDLPVAKNTSENNIVKPAESKKDKTVEQKNQTDKAVNSDINSPGKGNKANGNGSFGYDIDWGGKGQRKIYSYNVPAYPEGVEKEIDIRLRFSILPDGTVGTIVPLIKADTRLENAAINSLRQWRFEPLSPNQKQVPQTAVIVFPYRLQ